MLFTGINPYALGFGMMTDIQRICVTPTREDYEWFPDIAGIDDWRSVLKDAWSNYRDDSFVKQFLSPRVIRKMKLFELYSVEGLLDRRSPSQPGPHHSDPGVAAALGQLDQSWPTPHLDWRRGPCSSRRFARRTLAGPALGGQVSPICYKRDPGRWDYCSRRQHKSQDDRIAGPDFSGGVERLIAFADLARAYPDAKLVFTGGSGSLRPGALTEADVAEEVLVRLGRDVGRIRFEREARNTFESGRNARALGAPDPSENWLLVTSAMHMPRAMGVFRKAGWPVTAYPVDYGTGGDAAGLGLRFNLAGNGGSIQRAIREWVGLAAYKAFGRTDDWFPAPEDG